MPPLRLLFLLTLAVSLRVNAQPLPERRELNGRVISKQNLPLTSAQIQIRRTEQNANAVFWGATVLSNIAGEFSVPNAEDGDYMLTVTMPGYEIWNSPFTLNENAQPLRIVLRRKVSLTFTLLKPDGQPLPAQRASVFGLVTPAGQWQPGYQPGVPLGTTSLTTGDGTCTLSNRSEGVYHELYAAVRGVGYAKWIGKVEILEGETHHFDMELQKAPASLRLKAVEEPIDPAANTRPFGAVQMALQSVQTPQKNDAPLAQWLFTKNDLTTRDGTGSVELTDILPGRYQIRMQAPNGCDPKNSQPVSQTINVEPGQEKEVVFRLPQCQENLPSVQITIQDTKGTPLADREVRLMCSAVDEATGTVLPPAELIARGLPLIAVRRGLTDADGKLTLYPFWQGAWQITVFEENARITFYGVAKATVIADGAKITIPVALKSTVLALE
jgi:hypothetical protein